MVDTVETTGAQTMTDEIETRDAITYTDLPPRPITPRPNAMDANKWMGEIDLRRLIEMTAAAAANQRDAGARDLRAHELLKAAETLQRAMKPEVLEEIRRNVHQLKNSLHQEMQQLREFICKANHNNFPASFIVQFPGKEAGVKHMVAKCLKSVSGLDAGKFNLTETFRIRLVCERCCEARGDVYLVRQTTEFGQKALKVMKLTWGLAKAYHTVHGVLPGFISAMAPNIPTSVQKALKR